MSRSFTGSTVLMIHMMLGWLLLLAAEVSDRLAPTAGCMRQGRTVTDSPAFDTSS